MNAILQEQPWTIRPLGVADLDELMAIEVRAYAFPWSRGNFVDSLASGYRAQGLWHAASPAHGLELVAYCWAMPGVGELHLLNITVKPELQGSGMARCLLDDLVSFGRAQGLPLIWLEVRASNQRARALYERYGFQEVGLRRAYYPNAHSTREDAVVMRLDL